MTLETESLRRELRGEIGRISDRVDRHDSVIESHHRDTDDARALRALIVDALKQVDVLRGVLADHSRELNRIAKQVADWVRSARDACQRHDVAFHFKQWAGKRVPTGIGGGDGRGKIHLPPLDGRAWAEFPQ